ncbi:hypothetical protein L2E82_52372 [Cichorium intybus]|nr:hypothetical protein L2E82_52372 [Cichorium intybus]
MTSLLPPLVRAFFLPPPRSVTCGHMRHRRTSAALASGIKAYPPCSLPALRYPTFTPLKIGPLEGEEDVLEDLDGFVLEGIVGRVVGGDEMVTVGGDFLEGNGLLMEDFMEDDESLSATLVVEILFVEGFSSCNGIEDT